MSELLTRDAMAKAVIAQLIMCPDEIVVPGLRYSTGFNCKGLWFRRDTFFGVCFWWTVETEDSPLTSLPRKYNKQLNTIWKKAKYKKEHEKQLELHKEYLRAIGYDNV